MNFRNIGALALACALVACGGGESKGDFTIDNSALDFSGVRYEAPPASQTVHLHLNDSGAAYAGAGYRDEDPPTWLNVSATGSAPDFTFRFSIISTSLSDGTYTATVTLGTADANGNILRTKNVRVTYTVRTRLAINTAPEPQQVVYGDSATQRVIALNVNAGPATSWRISSSEAWLQTSALESIGPASTTVVVDASELSIGQHTGSIEVTNVDDATDTASTVVQVTVVAPEISIPAGLLIGGTDGLDGGDASIKFAVNTGTNTYPWTASLSTADGADWLSTDATSGTVGSATAGVAVAANRTKVLGGTYHGSIQLSVRIKDYVLTGTVPVTFNKEALRLHALSNGVAFVKLPSRQLLTRDIPIRSTTGLADVPWTAASDRPWLSVTPSGQTGDSLTLTANPAGLSADTVYRATVTVSSDLQAVENQETIEVGLWIGSSDPGQIDVSDPVSVVAVNPVLPDLYYASGDDAIKVLNIYTGAPVATWSVAGGEIVALAPSTDGKVLYVGDFAHNQVVGLDTITGARVATLKTSSQLYGAEMLNLRPNGHPTLIVGGSGDVFDLASGALVPEQWIGGRAVAASADGQDVWAGGSGNSPDGFSKFSMRYTALEGGHYRIEYVGSVGEISGGTVFSNCSDIAVSPDGGLVYLACGAPYAFGVFDGMTFDFLGFRTADAYPNSAAMGWNGHFFGGINGYYSDYDIWEYAADGTRIGTLRSAYGSLQPAQLQVSGDLMRVITVSDFLRIQDAP